MVDHMDQQDEPITRIGRPRTEHRKQLEAMKVGEWIHFRREVAKPKTIRSLLWGKLTDRRWSTRITHTGIKVWRIE